MTTKIEGNNWKVSWQFLSLVLALSFGAVGFVATSVLLRLPTNPSCTKISLFFSSATNRIYCAQLQAEKNTVDDLLQAIAILQVLSEDHPLRNEINRHIAQWSDDILNLAQVEFNEGNLEDAIAIARRIPENVANREMIEEKITQWGDIWQRAEKIEQEVENHLRQSQWNQAFLEAVNLLNINNEYWQSIRYQEIVKTINLAREESKQLDGAYVTLRQGGLQNLLKTIEIASVIPPTSYSYNEASKLIQDAEDKIVAIVEGYLGKNDWDNLSNLANQIPDNTRLRSQARDWNLLASAGRNANLGSVSAMELAIAEAEQIASDSKLYLQSRELVKLWTAQKEDLAYLASARELARSGDVDDLRAAIAKAELISSDNPVHRESRRDITKWQRDIQIIEDRPILAQAKQIAEGNNLQSWQNAINIANQISSNRALYSESSDLIRQWRRNIERVEDRPILDQAIAFGNSNNYQNAINVASRIGTGRALHAEAQTNIRNWRREISAQEDLQRAYQVAQNNDPQSLLQAINIARRISSSSSVGNQTRQAVDQWSDQLLNNARRLAESYSLSGIEDAIRIAEMIPRNTSAYTTAQQQIRTWRTYLNPGLNPETPSFRGRIPLEETSF